MQRAAKNKPESELSPRVENLLEDIDTGKVKMTRYTIDEYMKHVKKLLKEE
jgi:hypothetical protein